MISQLNYIKQNTIDYYTTFTDIQNRLKCIRLKLSSASEMLESFTHECISMYVGWLMFICIYSYISQQYDWLYIVAE